VDGWGGVGAAQALWTRLEPHLLGSSYINHLAEDDRPETVRASFGENYGRLRQLKAVYDPTNLFHLNARCSPLDGGGRRYELG